MRYVTGKWKKRCVCTNCVTIVPTYSIYDCCPDCSGILIIRPVREIYTIVKFLNVIPYKRLITYEIK